MGILRCLLALVVVYGHAALGSEHAFGYNLLRGDGVTAVQAFFVISGFYMAFIAEKYKLSEAGFAHIRSFYLSRFFRIYPLYYIVIILTWILYKFGICGIPHDPVETFYTLAAYRDKLLYVTSNLFIFGQDVMRFMVLDPNAHIFFLNPLTDKIDNNLLGSGFQFTGQSWSLALELVFYLIAPFLVTRSLALLVPICLMTFCLRYWLYAHHYCSYNITVAFFPTSLGIFLLGTIAYKMMYQDVCLMSVRVSKVVAYFFLAAILIVATHFYQLVEIDYEFLHWVFVFLVAVSLPFLFVGFKRSRIDNFIGELSYPIYMLHFIVMGVLGTYVTKSHVPYLIIPVVMVVSVVVNVALLNPLDKWRHRVFLSNKKANKAEIECAPDTSQAVTAFSG